MPRLSLRSTSGISLLASVYHGVTSRQRARDYTSSFSFFFIFYLFFFFTFLHLNFHYATTSIRIGYTRTHIRIHSGSRMRRRIYIVAEHQRLTGLTYFKVSLYSCLRPLERAFSPRAHFPRAGLCCSFRSIFPQRKRERERGPNVSPLRTQ